MATATLPREGVARQDAGGQRQGETGDGYWERLWTQPLEVQLKDLTIEKTRRRFGFFTTREQVRLYDLLNDETYIRTGFLGQGFNEKQLVEFFSKNVEDVVRCARYDWKTDVLFSNAMNAIDLVMKKGSREQKDAAKSAARLYIMKLTGEVEYMGFDRDSARRIVNSWSHVGYDEDYTNRGRSVYLNLRRIREMRESDRRMGQTLYREFGITHFGRYTKEMLDEQYRRMGQAETPYVLVINPRDDHDALLSRSPATSSIELLRKSLPEGWTARVIEVDSPGDAVRRSVRMRSRYGEPEFGFTTAHSNRYLIHYGPHRQRGEVSVDHLRTLDDPRGLAGFYVERVKSTFEPGFIFVIEGCEAGMSNAVGQELSRSLEATVIAPADKGRVKSIRLEEHGECTIPVVTYQSADGELPARIFHAGTEISQRQYRRMHDRAKAA